MQEDEEEDFDDETMMKFDDKIVAAFKQMIKCSKKEAKEKELQIVHFKIRLGVIYLLMFFFLSAYKLCRKETE